MHYWHRFHLNSYMLLILYLCFKLITYVLKIFNFQNTYAVLPFEAIKFIGPVKNFKSILHYLFIFSKFLAFSMVAFDTSSTDNSLTSAKIGRASCRERV